MPGKHEGNRETVPFPPVDQGAAIELSSSIRDWDVTKNAPDRFKASNSLSGRLRRLSENFEQSELPEGFFAATGGIASTIVTRQAAPRPASSSIGSVKIQPTSVASSAPARTIIEENHSESSRVASHVQAKAAGEPASAAPFANGYHFPPKNSFGDSIKFGALSFWNYMLNPLGFAVTIYGLNVVAWGGMLFLLLCNASPAMCRPTCDDINSPRRIWIEIDSQILNALFCVTGFGLAPWRFRDLSFLLQYRLGKKTSALRRLAGIHRGWFRLRGSNELPPDLGPRNVQEHGFQPAQSPAVPVPVTKIAEAPLTGVRAPPTKPWKLDLVIWLMVANTFLQCVLSGFMWGMNRYDRPSWSTGLFVALGCFAAGAGGFIMFLEGKAVKGIEGVPVSKRDLDRLEKDRERGIWHFNNLQDKDFDSRRKGVQTK